MMVLGLALVSCNSKPKEQPAATDPDAALVSAAENKLKAHQEDIQTLWVLSYGEDKKIANYYLAGDYVLIGTEDGKEEYLLYFFKDIKDIENPVLITEFSVDGNPDEVYADEEGKYIIPLRHGGIMEIKMN